MSKQTINIGASPNDGTGTPLRTSFDYTNQNFTELYTALGGGVGLPGATTQVIFNDGGTNLAGDAGLVYNKTTDALTVAGNVQAASATITGDLTVDTSTFYVSSSADKVGVGTTSLSGEKLTVAGNVSANAWIGRANISAPTADVAIYRAADNTFAISTANTERLRVDVSGNLGLGVTPSAWNYGKVIEFGGGSIFTDSGNNECSIVQGAYNNAGWKYKYTGLAVGLASNYLGTHAWYTAPSGTAGNAITFTQAMTLDASGNLLVGKTANYGAGETTTLQLKSSVIFASDNTGSASNRNWSIGTNVSGAGNMEWTISSTNTGFPNFAYRMQLTSAGDVNNTTGTYGTISDLRLKENISDARNYLADLLKLRVVKYSLKEESSAVATKLGFIAQEVEQVFPNLVDQSDKEYEGAEGIRSVKTSILIPMLLKAIQELTARVQTLEAR